MKYPILVNIICYVIPNDWIVDIKIADIMLYSTCYRLYVFRGSLYRKNIVYTIRKDNNDVKRMNVMRKYLKHVWNADEER